MKFNQFNPSSEKVKAIKNRNKYLSETERICYKCGHQYSVAGWCDTFLYNIKNSKGNWECVDFEDIKQSGEVYPPHACCEMECSYL